MWRICFQLLKMGKNKISWNIKTKCVTDIYWPLGLRLWRIIHFITLWSQKRQMFTLISIRIMRIWKFLFTSKRVCKHKEVVSNVRVCSNGLGKKWPSYTFHFCTKNSKLHTYEIIKYFFRIIYVAMSNIQISALDNVKMTCQTHKY